MIEFITVILSIIMIIVFFVMSSNIAEIKSLTQKQVRQYDEIIELLKRSTGQMSNEDKAKAFDESQKR